MSRTYRALISVPITADDDAEAQAKAAELAGRTADGHVELVDEVHADGLMTRRAACRSAAAPSAPCRLEAVNADELAAAADDRHRVAAANALMCALEHRAAGCR